MQIFWKELIISKKASDLKSGCKHGALSSMATVTMKSGSKKRKGAGS
ncbi:MAG: hypothetical protein ACLVKR_02005 [Lachnospiraceae bacterium]